MKALTLSLALGLLAAADPSLVPPPAVNVAEKILTQSDPVAQTEVIRNLPCFQSDPLYRGDLKDKFDALFSKVTSGITPNMKYVTVLSDIYRATYFAQDSVYYIQIEQKAIDAAGKESYSLYYNLFYDFGSDNADTCFKIVPQGCKFTGETFTTFEKVCQGYVNWADDIKKNLITVSVNGDFNPQKVADSFVECIKKTITVHSIPLECAVNGIKMDHDWALNQLKIEAANLQQKGFEVDIDEVNLKLSYSENQPDEIVKLTKDGGVVKVKK